MQGVLNVNKTTNMTSHDVVNILRKKLGIKKIGHAGTLDPMASGVLPICIGKATRIVEYLQNFEKEYISGIEFGYETDTLDITGRKTFSSDEIIDFNLINSIIPEFLGEIEQVPPIYSALKKDGKKLYEYARKGIDVVIPPRKISIYDLKLLDNKKIIVKCSKGTYVRSLVRDIGRKLNNYATMSSLVRTKIGPFTLETSLDIEAIKNMAAEEIKNYIIPIENVMNFLPIYNVPAEKYQNILNGVKYFDNNYDDLTVRIYCRDEFIGIGKFIKGRLKLKVFK